MIKKELILEKENQNFNSKRVDFKILKSTLFSRNSNEDL